MTQIDIVVADITKFETEAIVNAAHSSLLGGGGVDGAIHRAAGPELVAACRLLGGCKTGQAKMTPAFGIAPAQHIIHTVGPVYRYLDPAERQRLLAACYTNSLELARGMRSIAFPAISTGIYGYPLAEATGVAWAAITAWLAATPTTTLERISLLAFDEASAEVMRAAIA